MSSQEVVDFVRERIEKMSLTAICEEVSALRFILKNFHTHNA